MPPTAPINPLTEQEEMLYRLCEAGKMTRREIARQLEVSSTRVGQIYAAARTKLQDFAEHGEDALTLLPARARQVVVDCGIPSRSQARSAIESGRLTWTEASAAFFGTAPCCPR